MLPEEANEEEEMRGFTHPYDTSTILIRLADVQRENFEYRSNFSQLLETVARTRAELEEERKCRESLEARNRELTVRMYRLAVEQVRSVKAIRNALDSMNKKLRECDIEIDELRAATNRRIKRRKFE